MNPSNTTLWRTGPQSWAASEPRITGKDAEAIFGMGLVHTYPHIAIMAMRLDANKKLQIPAQDGQIWKISVEVVKAILNHPPSRRFMLEGAGRCLRWWEIFGEDDLQPEANSIHDEQEEQPHVLALHSPFMDPRMMLASIGKAALLADRNGKLKNIQQGSTTTEDVMNTAILYGYPETATELARRCKTIEPAKIQSNFYRKHRSSHYWQENRSLTIAWTKEKSYRLTPVAIGNLIAYDEAAREAFLAEGRQAKTITDKFLKTLANAVTNKMPYISGPWDTKVAAHILNDKIFKEYEIPRNLDEKHILKYSSENPPKIFKKQPTVYWSYYKKGALLALQHRYKQHDQDSPLVNSGNLQNSLSNHPKWYRQILHGYHLIKDQKDAPTPEQAWNALDQCNKTKKWTNDLNQECREFETIFPEEAASDWYQKFSIYRASTQI